MSNEKKANGFKDAGNKAFSAKNYQEAIKQYTLAIETSNSVLNHVFYSNRANAYLQNG